MHGIISRLVASERLRHAGIAIVLAVIVGATTILRPLDITVWSLQSKLFERQPSGDIVYVEVDVDTSAKGNATLNRRLANTLKSLDEAGASLVVVDLPIQRSKAPEIDAALRGELLRLRDKVVLTRTVDDKSDRADGIRSSDPYFEEGLRLASNDYQSDFLGYVWGLKPDYGGQSNAVPAIWARLAGPELKSERAVFPDFTINPTLNSRLDISSSGNVEFEPGQSIQNRKAVVSAPDPVRFPEYGYQPSGLLHIVAAETFLDGRGVLLKWPLMLAVYGFLLLTILVLQTRSQSRRLAYGVLIASIPVLLAGCAFLGARAEIAGPIAFIGIYGLQRLIVGYKRRHLFLEPRSRLANFAALRRDLKDKKFDSSVAIVVAKIARLDSIFTTLTQSEQGRYLRLIAKRLALGELGASIYYDGGKYFALSLDSSLYDDLEGHLHGLRAIASQAAPVGDRSLDVSMTLGVDCNSDASVAHRLSSAIAAADQAREAYRPVFVISDLKPDTEKWDHSLQTRLERALSENRIDIALQPQSDLQTGEIVAAEALARWVDRERGDVPPAQFIGQCERVGRLDELTKRVLSKSLDAGEALLHAGFDQQVSINLSAIQLVDDHIVSLIEQELSGRTIDPKRLTIEITESARIENFVAARDIIEQIKRAGPRFAIDDFGVESANFQTLFELPFDEIKIDQLFVRNVTTSHMARAIVSNLIRLANEAQLLSVAEGIESHGMFKVLREMGCARGQGYFIARPLGLQQFSETLKLQKDSQIRIGNSNGNLG